MSRPPVHHYLSSFSLVEVATQTKLDEISRTTQPLFTHQVSLITNSVSFRDKVTTIFPRMVYQEYGITGGIISGHDGFNFIKFVHQASGLANITIFGNRQFIDDVAQKLADTFNVSTVYITWMYGKDGNVIKTPLDTKVLPVDSMYPFLGEEKLTDYYDRFLASTANVLVLIGPPGTGKTTWIRGLLNHSKKSALVTYDPEIMENDSLFVKFMDSPDCGFLVMEDSDSFLSSRKDGNTMMHRFLNVSDGLVANRNKKIIFSTNLPSVRDVDSALIRPGRCFDVVKFAHLTSEQAEKMALDMDIKFDPKQSRYSVAELFHGSLENKIGNSFGFN